MSLSLHSLKRVWFPSMLTNNSCMMFSDVFIQGNGYISYCFHEYNMTCTCEKCNQKRVIDCLFVKLDVNLHIARQTQLFLKINSLSSGTMAESCWESSSDEELFLTQSTFTVQIRGNWSDNKQS